MRRGRRRALRHTGFRSMYLSQAIECLVHFAVPSIVFRVGSTSGNVVRIEQCTNVVIVCTQHHLLVVLFQSAARPFPSVSRPGSTWVQPCTKPPPRTKSCCGRGRCLPCPQCDPTCHNPGCIFSIHGNSHECGHRSHVWMRTNTVSVPNCSHE